MVCYRQTKEVILATIVLLLVLYHSGLGQDPKYQTLFGMEEPNHLIPGTLIRSIIYIPSSDMIVAAGITTEDGYPTTEDAFKGQLSGTADGILVMFDNKLQQAKYLTYFGGGDYDNFYDVKLYDDSCVVLCGVTRSDDLPITMDAIQPERAGDLDGFVLVVNTYTYRVVYCSYYGGANREVLKSLDVSEDGELYLSGFTNSETLPGLTNAYQKRLRDIQYDAGDAMVVRMDIKKGELNATYLGGAFSESATKISVSHDNIFISGETNSLDLPVTPGAFQKECAGKQDVFYAALNRNLSELRHLSYLGTPNLDTHVSQAAHGGEVVIAAHLQGGYFVTEDSLVSGSPFDCAYIIQLSDKLDIEYATFFGGTSASSVYDLAMNDKYIYVCGRTFYSAEFPGQDSTFVKNMDEPWGYVSSIRRTPDHTVKSTFPLHQMDGTVRGIIVTDNEIIYHGTVLADSVFTSNMAFQRDRRGYADAVFGVLDINRVLSARGLMGPKHSQITEIYPNPSSGPVSLSWTSSMNQPAQLRIMDQLGRVVQTKEIPPGITNATWDASDAAPGVYFMQIMHDKGIETGKVLVR